MSNFAFLQAEFPEVHEAALSAECYAVSDPTAAAFFAGKTVEVAVKWAFRADKRLKLPYQDNIAALLHEPSFRRAAGEAVFAKARYINTLRNRAVHEEKRIAEGDARGAVKELFHVCFWFARAYARGAKPAEGTAFDATQLTRRDDVLRRSLKQLQAMQAGLEASLAGHFARIITHESGAYAQTLIDDFSKKDRAPHIAISVDMLDTGIDVPEVVNLVFFKTIRSKTKFWRMMGRGTRLCPDLFGPGQHKEFFRVFDFCQNLEFFAVNPDVKEASASPSLSARLFVARLDLVRALDDKTSQSGGMAENEQKAFAHDGDAPPSEQAVRGPALAVLRETVVGLQRDSFLVRQKRRLVEKYDADAPWTTIDQDTRYELVGEIAPLPSSRDLGVEEAKRFDWLMFSLQLALLKVSKRFLTLKKDLLAVASALEDQTAIPAIAARAALIEEIQTPEWWEGITVPLLEWARLRLRDLVHHIEKGRRTVLYSNFADEIGVGEVVGLPQIGDFSRFKLKARAFLREREDHIALHKLRQGKPLTATDLAELEKMLLDAGIGDAETLARAREGGFGRFVRSLVRLDRQAVQNAFAEFLGDGTASADQIEFIRLVVERLTAHGEMEPKLLHESPFIDIAPQGPEQVFDEARVDHLFRVIGSFNESAVT